MHKLLHYRQWKRVQAGEIRNDAENGEDLPLQPSESEGDEKGEDSIDVNAQDPPLPPGKARAEKIRNDAESGEDLPLYTANDYRMLF